MILKYELLNFKLKFKDNDLRYSSQNDYILDIIFIHNTYTTDDIYYYDCV